MIWHAWHSSAGEPVIRQIVSRPIILCLKSARPDSERDGAFDVLSLMASTSTRRGSSNVEAEQDILGWHKNVTYFLIQNNKSQAVHRCHNRRPLGHPPRWRCSLGRHGILHTEKTKPFQRMHGELCAPVHRYGEGTRVDIVE
jgi:hypothetical protein